MPKVITNNLDLWSSALRTKSTAGRGSNGKQEAYGIKKLRELILELAVRGELLTQDPNDEPASKLRKRIQAEKDGLIAAGKIKKDKPLSPIADEDKPFTQPPGWEWVRLGEIAETIRGVTYCKSDASDIPLTDCVPLLRGNNINRTLNFDNPVFVPKQLLNDAQYVKAGDIVIAMSSGSADLVGKAAQATGDFNGGFGAFCGVVRSVSGDIFGFLGFFFQTPLYRNRAAGHGKGIGINNLQKTALQTLEIPLPPIAEQHRIVAKVDELMALCDQLEQQQTHSLEAHQTLVETLLGTLTCVASQQELTQAWTRIAHHFDTLFTTEHSIDQLKQTILQLAVMGKLVPQDPNDEPASELLGRIAGEKEHLASKGKIKEEDSLPAISDDEKPFQLPELWKWARFGWLVNFKSELVRPEGFADLDQVAPDSIEKGTGKLLYRRTVSESGVRGPNNRFYPGQILYSKIRPSLSKAIIAPFEGLCSADMYPLESMVDSAFLLKAILSEPFLEQVRVAENRIKMPKLNIDSLSRMVVPVPPLAEQHRIVAKVAELMALCDALKARIKDAQTTQIHFADAIVEQAVA